MSDRVTRWKCPGCHGTGEIIVGGKIRKCAPCDGTGNAMVDGETERHKRELARIRRGQWEDTFEFTRGRPYDGAYVDEDGKLRLP